MKLNYIILCLIFLLGGCSQNFKQKVGFVTTGPNEYEVTKVKELEVPPFYELPQPQIENKITTKHEKKKGFLFFNKKE